MFVSVCLLVVLACALLGNVSANSVVDLTIDLGLEDMNLPSLMDMDVGRLGIPVQAVKRALLIDAEQTFQFDTTIVLNGVAAATIPVPARDVIVTALSTATGVAAAGFAITDDVVTGTSPSFTHTLTVRTQLNTATVTSFVNYRDIGVVYYGVKNSMITLMNSGFFVAALKSFSIQAGNALFTSTTFGSYTFTQTMETTPPPEEEPEDKNLKRGRIAAAVIMTVFGFFAISAIVYYGLIFFRAHKPVAQNEDGADASN